MKLIIEINMDNAAFEYEPGWELDSILCQWIGKFDGNLHEFKREVVQDRNGNTVGHVQIIDTEDF